MTEDYRGPFAKVYLKMWDGTLGNSWEAWTTWVYLLASCSRGGVVDKTPEAIAAGSRLPLDVVKRGLAVLVAEDPFSRNSAEGGRRLVPLDPTRAWGWRIVNLARWRVMTDAERAAQWRSSRGVKPEFLPVTERDDPSRGVTPANYADSDSEADSEAKNNPNTSCTAPEPGAPPAEGLLVAHDRCLWPIRGSSGPELIRLPCVAPAGEVAILDSVVKAWAELYPGVDVPAKLRAMRGWLLTHPDQRKTPRGMAAFVNTWLMREQDRGPGRQSSKAPKAGHRSGADSRYAEDNEGNIDG